MADSPKNNSSTAHSDVSNGVNLHSDKNAACSFICCNKYISNKCSSNIMICDKSLMISWFKWCLGLARQQAKMPYPMLINIYATLCVFYMISFKQHCFLQSKYDKMLVIKQS